MTVQTQKVVRRKLSFDTISQVQAEIDRILQAHQSGTLVAMGNWTPGQIMAHVAAWIEYGYQGYPMAAPPVFLRWLLRMMGKRYLSNGMPAGVRIPGVRAGTFGADDMPLEQAHQRLTDALWRLERDHHCPYDSPAFGPLCHEDRIRLNLRHAELHLGFLNYPAD